MPAAREATAAIIATALAAAVRTAERTHAAATAAAVAVAVAAVALASAMLAAALAEIDIIAAVVTAVVVAIVPIPATFALRTLILGAPIFEIRIIMMMLALTPTLGTEILESVIAETTTAIVPTVIPAIPLAATVITAVTMMIVATVMTVIPAVVTVMLVPMALRRTIARRSLAMLGKRNVLATIGTLLAGGLSVRLLGGLTRSLLRFLLSLLSFLLGGLLGVQHALQAPAFHQRRMLAHQRLDLVAAGSDLHRFNLDAGLAEQVPCELALVRQHEGHHVATVAGARGATGTMLERLGVFRRLGLHHEFHAVHIDAACRHIGGDQHAHSAVSERSKVAVALVLRQIALQVDCGNALLDEFLGHLLRLELRAREENALAHAARQFANHLMLVALGDGEQVVRHRVHGFVGIRDSMHLGIGEELFDHLVDAMVKRRRKQHALSMRVGLLQKARHGRQEAHVRHFVSLVKHADFHTLKGEQSLAQQVFETPGAREHNVGAAAQLVDLAALFDAAVNRDGFHAIGVCERLDDLVDLIDELTGGGEHHTTRMRQAQVRRLPGLFQALEITHRRGAASLPKPRNKRDGEGKRLARTRAAAAEDIAPGQRIRQRIRLNGECGDLAILGEHVHDWLWHAKLLEREVGAVSVVAYLIRREFRGLRFDFQRVAVVLLVGLAMGLVGRLLAGVAVALAVLLAVMLGIVMMKQSVRCLRCTGMARRSGVVGRVIFRRIVKGLEFRHEISFLQRGPLWQAIGLTRYHKPWNGHAPRQFPANDARETHNRPRSMIPCNNGFMESTTPLHSSTSEKTEAINVEGLTKSYGDMRALDSFDLTVHDGEIFGLLGPNGSGKTTAIRCMLGLLTFESGSITILGERMTPRSYELRRRIGVVPQDVAVFDALNVQENIDYFCSLYVPDRTRRAQLVDEAIEFVGLEDYRRFRPKKLSGGLLRRLNIACGIAHKPELIFFDEPTVAVDPQSRNAILEGIKRLNAQGATVVYTSHYMEEVEQICDRILIMDRGRHLALGTATQLTAMTDTGETITVDAADLTDDVVSAIEALPHVDSIDRNGSELTIVCTQGDRNLIDVLDALHGAGVHIGHVTSQPPTLNDVFLALTGKKLRD